MTDITWYIASTKGYLQQCDSLRHALGMAVAGMVDNNNVRVIHVFCS